MINEHSHKKNIELSRGLASATTEGNMSSIVTFQKGKQNKETPSTVNQHYLPTEAR